MGEIINFPGYKDNFIKLPDEMNPNTYAYIDRVYYESGTYKADMIFRENNFKPDYIGGFPCLNSITKKPTFENLSVVFVTIERSNYIEFIHMMKKVKDEIRKIEPNYDKACEIYLDINLFKYLSMEKIIKAIQ